MAQRSKNWTFTLNNYTKEDENHFLTFDGHKQVKYVIIGKEIGEIEHTQHLQGFIMFYNQKTFNQAKKFIHIKAHIEKTKGDAHENIAYCSKDNEILINYGELPPGQGSRTDIDVMKEQLNNGTNIDTIINSCSSYQSMRTAEILFKYQKQPPAQKRHIQWIYGKTGVGKTRSAIEQAGNDYYITSNTLKWWNGYTGQKYIIIDELRSNSCMYSELLRLIDRYPIRLETKGSSLWMQPTTTNIIITSAYHPDYIFKTMEDTEQIKRRIDEIIELQ